MRLRLGSIALVVAGLACGSGAKPHGGGGEGGQGGDETPTGGEAGGGRGGRPADAAAMAGADGRADAGAGTGGSETGGTGGGAPGTGGAPGAGGAAGMGGAGGGPVGDCPVAPAIYLPGAMAAAGPQRTTVDIAGGDLAAAQARIDMARAANATAVLDIRMSGTFLVTSQPLELPSLSTLSLTGTLRAAPGATAAALVAIEGASKVAVVGGTFDGGGAALTGISVLRSSKVTIDGVDVRGAGRDGIVVDGTGNATPEVRVAIVRSTIDGARQSGIAVRSAAQVVVANNRIGGSGGPGIQVAGAHSIVANNTVKDGSPGIQVAGTDNAVSKNSVCGASSLALADGSASNSLFHNTLTGALALGGMGNLVFDNAAGSVKDGGTGNYVVPASAASAAANNYFRPPTIKNRHQDAAIVNGKGRQNLAVMGTTLDQVQVQYDALRAAHPNDFIVLTLTGAFRQGGAGLSLQSYTAVILDGTITLDPGATGAALRAATGTSFVAISGGTIEGNGRAAPGIQLSTTMAYVDGVTVQHFGVATNRTSGGAIHLSGNGGFAVVRGCRVDGTGGRAIWTQNAGRRYLMLNNHVSGANMDGIDFDSHTANSIATGNRCESNTRYGVFIEEGAKQDKVWDNDLVGNSIGVNVYAFASGPTEKSTIFMNRLMANRSVGVRIGSQPTFDSSHNFVFDNAIGGSPTGLRDEVTGVDNYFSQNVLSGNTKDTELSSTTSDLFDFAPPP